MASTGLQTIVNFCNSIQIDRRNVVGTQFTRNEIPRVSLTPTLNPWRIKLEMPNSFKYYEARALMEQIDTLDRYQPQIITFSNLPQLNWIFAYQGTMSTAQIGGITVQSFVGDQLVLQNLPVVPATRVLFEPNDLIQIGNYTYPFTSTTQVTRGSGGTVTVTTHRPNIITGSVAGNGITVGNACEFYMFCPNMPTYKMIPGGQTMLRGQVISNALIEWSDAFQLYEWVQTA
jgi:hypothetical protein